MHIVVDWVGVTSAMIAKERLRKIIYQDRQMVPSCRWKLICQAADRMTWQHLLNGTWRPKYRWDRRK